MQELYTFVTNVTNGNRNNPEGQPQFDPELKFGKRYLLASFHFLEKENWIKLCHNKGNGQFISQDVDRADILLKDGISLAELSQNSDLHDESIYFVVNLLKETKKGKEVDRIKVTLSR